ncbi:hypothetical protein FQN57_003757 [Myotisia sp. PD_48]|nr:hypothetical protein FQN57_003757 [Myotisia sp. PD_48]
MPSRRSHRKSRLGCLQCKRRKIKCDEAPPPCGNCKKHDIPCQFAPPAKRSVRSSSSSPLEETNANNARNNNSQRLSAPTTATISAADTEAPLSRPTLINLATTAVAEQQDIFGRRPDPGPKPPSILNLDDLGLFHHYMTKTYYTLSTNNEHEEIWKNAIPEEAIAHPFLMHGLLALAALHLVECSTTNSEKKRKYIELATHHQTLALSAFRPELNNLTDSNCQAVFAFSSIIAALAFAFSKADRTSHLADPISQVLQNIQLFRGVEGVLTVFFDTILRSKLGPLVRRSADPSCAQVLSKDVVNALDYLHDCNGQSVTSIPTEEKAIYNHAIRELRISFERGASSCEGVFRWPMVVPETYMALLTSRKPMALVILGHYCVIMKLSTLHGGP